MKVKATVLIDNYAFGINGVLAQHGWAVSRIARKILLKERINGMSQHECEWASVHLFCIRRENPNVAADHTRHSRSCQAKPGRIWANDTNFPLHLATPLAIIHCSQFLKNLIICTMEKSD